MWPKVIAQWHTGIAMSGDHERTSFEINSTLEIRIVEAIVQKDTHTWVDESMNNVKMPFTTLKSASYHISMKTSFHFRVFLNALSLGCVRICFGKSFRHPIKHIYHTLSQIKLYRFPKSLENFIIWNWNDCTWKWVMSYSGYQILLEGYTLR